MDIYTNKKVLVLSDLRIEVYPFEDRQAKR